MGADRQDEFAGATILAEDTAGAFVPGCSCYTAAPGIFSVLDFAASLIGRL
jgi:hypothetical protein